MDSGGPWSPQRSHWALGFLVFALSRFEPVARIWSALRFHHGRLTYWRISFCCLPSMLLLGSSTLESLHIEEGYRRHDVAIVVA